ncbi:MAG: carbonic anhydrase [Chitinophagaceae bacterium]|nr:carbonic anhydrase [Chitinophagaceae bacterium]MDB5223304.1 carbonic anhydrase [Chitinophagaceae bacterium]
MKLSTFKKDLPASIVVFLVALPLCLGVALASGAPLLSGIISGIIGGIVVGFLSGSQTSVSGPAAGLAAVVLGSITQLGSFEIFLTAVMLSGVIQIIMGLFKGGIIANYIPSNVIKGLLAAIGIILILKQLPHAVGYDAVPEENFSFEETGGENTFSRLLRMINYITPGALIISVISILILICWDKTRMKKLGFLPSSLFVVIIGIVINSFFNHFVPALLIEQSHLVNLPPIDTGNLKAYIHFPDLSYFSNHNVYLIAFTIAIVASLETLLNVEAIDKIDPHKRETPTNRELIVQGIGNITAGLFGGIPITSVIVRSSVNINAGNATKLSAILHGILMLVSVIALGSVLNLIPLASLAAILLMTGYKLAKISLFKEMYKKGWQQFIPFVVTILAVVFTDLLIGVLIGLAVSIFYLLRSNFYNPFTLGKEKLSIGEIVKLELSDEVSFLNKASIRNTLWSIPQGSKVIIDATNSSFIDEDVLEIIDDFKITVAPERNIQLNILGLKKDYEHQDHIHFINVLDKETQLKLTPAHILDLLIEGNKRFRSGKSHEKDYRHQVNATSFGQNPMAVIISCIDSRTSPEIIFDAGIGDLLTIRIAGNIISPEILGSIELSVKEIGAKLIVVMGHSNCGAVNAAIEQLKDGNIGYITSKIENAVLLCDLEHKEISINRTEKIKKVTWYNVKNSISNILEESNYLNKKLSHNEVGIVGAYYDTNTAEVSFTDFIKKETAVAIEN